MPWLHFLLRLLGSLAWAAPESASFYYVDLSTEPPQVVTFTSDARDTPKVGIGRGPTRQRGRESDSTFCPIALIEECEAYVAGRFQEYLERNNLPIPVWAWINSVAHGDLEVVQQLAETNDRSGGPQAAVTDVAKQVLRIVDQHRQTLLELQFRVLIPLEAALIDARPTEVPVDAAQLRYAIRRALGSGHLP